MLKKEFYKKYETEHQQVKEVVDNWSCSSCINNIHENLNNINTISIICEDDIGIDFMNNKNTIVGDITTNLNLLEKYDTNAFMAYSKLLKSFDELCKFDENFRNVVNNRPHFSEKKEYTQEEIFEHQRQIIDWERSVTRAMKNCVFTENNIKKIKKYLDEINNMEVNDVFPIMPLLTIISYYDGTEFDEFGCPLSLKLENGDIYDYSEGYLPGDIELENELNYVRLNNYIVDSEIVKINGVDLPIYYVYDSKTSEEIFVDYTKESIEYIKLVPNEVLKSIVGGGTKIVYQDYRNYTKIYPDTNGVFLPYRNMIVIGTGFNRCSFCVVHEIGHAFDNSLIEGPESYYSDNYNWSMNDAVYLNSIDTAGYDENDYINNKKEFFAESFLCYLLKPGCLNNTESIGKSVEEMISLAKEN